jgi:hypothetical protein
MAGLWITVDELDPQFQENEYAQDAVKTASYLMWSMSGRKYVGTQTITERYVRFAPLLNMHLLQEAALVNAIVTKTTEMIEPWVSAETRIRLRNQPVQSIQTVRSTKGEVYSQISTTLSTVLPFNFPRVLSLFLLTLKLPIHTE